MAYTMTHILIAEEVISEFGQKINYATYMLGTIAPDAVHVRTDFNVVMKEQSHLFSEGLEWGKISSEEEARSWIDNIKKYYSNNIHKYNDDFLLGYVVHLLADVYCSIHFFTSFRKTIKGNQEEKMAQYIRESYGVNYFLYSSYIKTKDLNKILMSGKAITLAGVIDKETIKQRVDQLFQYEFNNWDISCIDEYTVCRLGDMKHLINEASIFVKKILDEEFS